jgi:hypothetical protein
MFFGNSCDNGKITNKDYKIFGLFILYIAVIILILIFT